MSEKLYTPDEAAKKLGITVRMLGHYRRTGRISGTSLGNTTVYSEEQIANADLTRYKPGPKSPDSTHEANFAIAL